MTLQDAAATLTDCIAAVDRLPSSCEPEFLRIGNDLVAAVGTLDRMQAQMQALRERLTGDALAQAREVLQSGTTTLAGLVGDDRGDKAALAALHDIIARALARIAPLTRVIGEIGVLAVNAKIQASQVTATGVDFSVFTREISRLRDLAGESVERCRQGLDRLATVIDAARRTVESFERQHCSSLAEVRQNLEQGLADLREQDKHTAKLVSVLNARSAEISSRLNAVVAALQINDITMQRAGHVREALDVLVDLAGGGRRDEALAGREHLVIAAACRLQALQMSRAADDFATEVGRVISELRQLGTATGTLAAEAEDGLAAGGHAAGGSFIEAVERDCNRALSFLDAFHTADQEVRSTIAGVSAGVQGMARDVEAIRSVEVDMRIMGLNATLKCGRLGTEGRSLAVIAQELRSYGNRTGEDSRAVAALLTEIAALGTQLVATGTDQGEDGVGAIDGDMRRALGMLADLGGSLSATLDAVRQHGGAAAARLAGLVDGVRLHESVPTAMAAVARALEELADRLDPTGGAGNQFADEVKNLLQQNYTMESERIIHALFADGADANLNAPTSATASVEEFFL